MSLQRDEEGEDGGVLGAILEVSCSFVRLSSSAFTDPRISPGGTTSTSPAPPCFAHLATDHDTLVFADFPSKGAETSGSSEWPQMNVFKYKPGLRRQTRYRHSPVSLPLFCRPYTYDPHLFTRRAPFQK
jgi:hypothetical protein